MVTEVLAINSYYALPGRAAEVLAARRRAEQRRRDMGLPPGQILTIASPSEGQPDVIWLCEYASLEVCQRSIQLAEADPGFQAIRHAMQLLFSRFERQVFVPDRSPLAD